MKLTNISIFSNSDALYLTKADDHLIKLTGNNKNIIESVIESFTKTENLDEAYSYSKDALDNNRDFFLQIVNWLKENLILVEDEQRSPDIKQIKIALYGYFNHITDTSENFINKLNNELYEYSLSSFHAVGKNEFSIENFLNGSDIILLFSPFYNDSKITDLINRESYKRNIPIFHIGVDSTTFTIGPIIVPSLLVPCFKCYEKRRFANLPDPDGYWDFITISNKKNIHSVKITENKIFPILIEFVKKELSKFLSEDPVFSALLNRTIKFDSVNYQIAKSKIIRTNDCDVCNRQTVYAPFDA